MYETKIDHPCLDSALYVKQLKSREVELYRVIILFDYYKFSHLVSSLILWTQPTQLTAHMHGEAAEGCDKQ